MKMRSIDEALEMAATAMEVIHLMEGDVEDDKERAVRLLSILSLVIGMVSIKVGGDVGKHPRDVVTKVVEEVLGGLPQKPAPEPQDLPSRPVKPGPSPWAL